MGAPATTGQPLRRARLGVRGYLILYAAGLGSMLLGGSVVHAVAQPDLVCCWVAATWGRLVSPPFPLVPCVGSLLAVSVHGFDITSCILALFLEGSRRTDTDVSLVCVLYVLCSAVSCAAVTYGGGSGGDAIGV